MTKAEAINAFEDITTNYPKENGVKSRIDGNFISIESIKLINILKAGHETTDEYDILVTVFTDGMKSLHNYEDFNNTFCLIDSYI